MNPVEHRDGMHDAHEPTTPDNRRDFSGGNDRSAGLRLGELLVRQGLLTAQQVNHVLDVQAAVGRPFGDLAERLFGVPPVAVEAAWAHQFVAVHGERNVTDVACEAECLAMLSPRQAWQFRLVPMRRELNELGDAGHVLVATPRRGLRRAMTFAARALPVAPSFVVATPSSVRALLARHYPVAAHVADWAFEA